MSKPSLQLGGDWAVKESNILGYAVGKSGKYVPREFAFERGTDLTATRVNKDGLIEKGRENKFLHSNSFSSNHHWGHNGLHSYYGPETNPGQVPDDEQGYDGSGDASFIVCSNTDGAVHRFQSTEPSGTAIQTFSIYAKALGYKWLAITTNRGTMEAYFDLENGQIGTVESDVIEAKMIDAGNGWYRCSIALNDALSVTTIGFGIAEGDENHEFDGNKDQGGTNRGGIYVMHAQWELGQVATEYLDSGSSTKKAGITEDLPRISYNDGKPQLLIENKSVNLIPYSEYIGAWAFNGEGQVEYNFNYAVSPDGTKNATHYRAANGYRHLRKSVTLETDQKYVFSFYVKNIDADRLRARVYNVDDSDDIINSTEGDYFSQVSTEEWRRIEFAFTTNSVDTTYAVYLTDGQTLVESASSGGNVLFWGAQLEKYHSHDEATSYIPTYGTTATRTFDKPTFDYDAATKEWTVFMDVEDMTIQGDDSNQGHFFFRGRPNNNVSALFFYGTCFGYRTTDTTASDYPLKYACGKLGNGGDVFSGKFAVSYDGNTTMKIYVDGDLDSTITDVDPDFAQGIQSGGLSYNDANTNTRRKINKLQIYNEELSQSDCEALTA